MAKLVVGRFDDIVQANRLLDALHEDRFALRARCLLPDYVRAS